MANMDLYSLTVPDDNNIYWLKDKSLQDAKGAANGIAELDSTGKVPSSQLPSYVDDVIEVDDYAHLPITGESGKIYVTKDTNKTYRWTGTGYVEISESLALGETESTAYRGDRGKTAYNHATETKLSTTTASGLYKVAGTAQGHIASLTAVTKSDITALGIPGSDTNNAVTQTATTTNSDYELLFSATADNTTRTEGTGKNLNLKANPSTGKITSEIIKVNKYSNRILLNGTGTAGGYRESKHFPSLWNFDIGLVPVDGDEIIIKVPVAGYSKGVWLSTDNGTTYHPVWSNGRYTTTVPVNYLMHLVYDSDAVTGIYAINGSTGASNVTGSWCLINWYNTDSNVTQTPTTLNNNYEVIFSNAANNTSDTGQVRKNNNFIFNPYNGLLNTPYYGSDPTINARLTSINFTAPSGAGAGKTMTRFDLVTTDVATGAPPADTNKSSAGYVQTYYWDNGVNAMSQIYVPNGDHIATRNGPQGLMIRGQDNGAWNDWVKIPFFTTDITSGQVLVSDGTMAGIKSSGYTIAKSVPSNADFSNTTYTIATGDANGQIKVSPSGQTAYNVSVKGLGDAAYKGIAASVASGNTDLVTSGAVYTAISGLPAGTVTSVATGVGLTGGTITSSGTIKAYMKSETKATYDSNTVTNTQNRQYAVTPDKTGYLSVNVPWEDHTYTAATAAPGDISSSAGAAGTSTNYARQDHTHKISLTTGDANGQVKIAGTNVDVKGLGSNAYTSTAYLPLTGGTLTGNLTIQKVTPNLVLDYTNTDIAAGQDISAINVKYKNTTGDVTFNLYPMAIIGSDKTNADNAGIRFGSSTGLTILSAGEGGVAFARKNLIYSGESVHIVADDDIILYKSVANDGTYSVGPLKAAGFSGTITTGKVVVSDGAAGGMISSNYTIAKSVPSDADFSNTTYTFANGTNGFTVTPSGGTAQTVTVTPSITNNITGTGTNGYLTKFNGTNTITNGPQLGSSTTTYLRNDGSWATPTDTNTHRPIQMNGTEILGNNTTVLNLKAGSNVTLSNDGGTVTINSSYSNTDTKVTQTVTHVDNTYNILFAATPNSGDTTLTEGAGKDSSLKYNPHSGQINIIPYAGTNEGGQINLCAGRLGSTYAGTAIDNWNSKFRIFGIQSADGTTKTGTGTALEIDPYAKTITGGYTLTGALSGNASTATKATQDSDGNAINTTYLKLSGGSISGVIKPTTDGSLNFGDAANRYHYGYFRRLLCVESITRSSTYNEYQLTLPAQSGTIAVTSDLSSYLPLSGGTLTGKLQLKTYNEAITGTGTAAVTTSPYYPAIWTFDTGLTASDGDVFIIKVPVDGHDNGIFLSIDNGTNYYPISCNNTARLTTPYAVGQYIMVLFKSDGSTASIYPVAGGTARVTVTGGAWIVLNYYDSGNTDTINQSRYQATVKASSTGCTNTQIIVGNNGTFSNLKTGGAFDITYPILYCGRDIAANGTDTKNYSYIGFAVKNTQNMTLTAYKPVYIKGTLNGNIFTPVSTTPLTQTVPSSVDNYQYILLGVAYSTTNIFLIEDHRIFEYSNGNFHEYIPNGADTKVTQTPSTTNANYEILFSATADNTEHTESTGKAATLRFNPNKGSLMEGNSTVASGNYAHAEGYLTTSSGCASHTEGYKTSAINDGFYDQPNEGGAHAEGYETMALACGSHAEGGGTTAYDAGSHAEGGVVEDDDDLYFVGTYAYGMSSHAEGLLTCAEGDYSHAEGSGYYDTLYDNDIWVIARGSSSHAEGYCTTAYGTSSHAEGSYTSAKGNYSHAEGYGTSSLKVISSGTGSHAEGAYTTASGNYSHSEGLRASASGQSSHAEGSSTVASGNYSHAEGSGTQAKGKYSHAEGSSTCAVSYETADDEFYASHAEGWSTTAYGSGAHAEGNGTYASDGAHAEGGLYIDKYGETEANGTFAYGLNSHSEGYKTTASGEEAHAEGSWTFASSEHSHAEGWYTTSSNFASHASGHRNAAMTTGGTGTNTTGTAFVIGNGTSTTNLKNAFSVQYSGVVKAASTITASTAADYAEYFEWTDENPNNEDRVGYFVTFNNGDKIRIATSSDDYILGITSGEPFVLGNGDCDVWNGMVMRDKFRRTIYEPAPEMEDIGNGELIPKLDKDGNQVYCGTRPVYNPDYDPTKPYVNRADRPEWCPVGMLGVLAVRDDGTCEVNGYATINNSGIATKATSSSIHKYRVIKRNDIDVVEVVFR